MLLINFYFLPAKEFYNQQRKRVSFLQRPSGLSHEDSSHLQETQSRSAAAPHQKEAGGGASDF